MKTKLIVWFILIFPLSLWAAEPNWDTYDALLNQYVHARPTEGGQNHLVDYLGLKRDKRFQEVVKMVETYDTKQLRTKHEILSFYINAYNIFVINMVLENWPIKSIKDAGNLFRPVWNKEAGSIQGRPMSLMTIEHEILRDMNDPRFHFAINCASLSCPNLRKEAYRAHHLNAQLDDQTRLFLQDKYKGLRSHKHNIKISKIFKWFEDDFAPAGGVESFCQHYVRLPFKVDIEGYLDYHWELNKTY